jgi:hypothetical protein
MKLLEMAGAALAVLFLVLGAAACEGFYEDVPTATMGPSAAGETPTEELTGTRAERAETAARDALAARLHVQSGEPAFAGLVGATWTQDNPGCYPPPVNFQGDYLVPGLRLSLLHDGVLYEYHSNLEVTNGSLCDDVPRMEREVAVSLAEDSVTTLDAPALIGRTVAIPDQATARELLEQEPGIAEFQFETIDWTSDVLVGTALTAGPSPVEVTDVSASWDLEENTVTIDVALESVTGDEVSPTPVWVLVEYPPGGAKFRFTVTTPVPGLETPEE